MLSTTLISTFLSFNKRRTVKSSLLETARCSGVVKLKIQKKRILFKNNKIPTLDDKILENIFDNNIENIYENSDYLKTVRELVKQFSCENNCENCLGQYLLKEKK